MCNFHTHLRKNKMKLDLGGSKNQKSGGKKKGEEGGLKRGGKRE
jgi:hypothetical protein